MSRCTLSAPALALVAVGAAIVPAAGQSGPETVYVEIAIPGEPASYVFESVALGREEITIPVETRVEALLRERDIYPDGEAFALVYELNPDRNAPSAPAGTSLTMPVLEYPEDVSSALTQGHVAYVRPYFDLKLRLVDRARSLVGRADALADVDAALFGGVGRKAETLRAVAQVSDFAISMALAIQNRTRPLDRAYLEQIELELELVANTVENVEAEEVLDETRYVRLQDLATVAEVRQPYLVDDHGPALNMAAPATAPLAVEVLDGSRRVGGLRVYYVWNAGRGRRTPNGLPELTMESRPVTSPPPGLTVANYWIWAGEPGDTTALTDSYYLELRARPDSLPFRVQLSLGGR